MPVYTGDIAEPGRLDQVLARRFPELSRARWAALIKSGRVRVGADVVTRPATRIGAGTVVTCDVPAPTPAEAVAQDLPVHIVYEDADLAVIDKAAGMVVHPAPGHPDGTLVNALLHHLDDLSGIGGQLRPGIVHRLDKGTSGLMVVAKHDQAHHHLAAQFAAHTAGRTYWALCLGQPGALAGTCRSEVARHRKDRVRWASTTEGGKRAVTHWWLRGQAGTVCWIECRLETGRTHQVRVHLSEAGWPLLGDPLYHRGKRRPPATLRGQLAEERPLLHAVSLALVHPRTGQPLRWCAEPPADWQAAHTAVGLPDWRLRYGQLSSEEGS